MAIELDQDIMVTNLGVKFGEDRTHTSRRRTKTP